MSSPHAADPSVFNDPITMLTGADVMSATQLRQSLEEIHDNTAYLNERTTAVLPTAALKLRSLVGDVAITDTDNFIGVVDGITPGHGCLLIKSQAGGVGIIGDWDFRKSFGSVASITGFVCGAARFSDRIVAIGTGGNRCCVSLDEGNSWSAGDDLGATPHAIVYNQADARFMVTYAAGVNVAQDVDAATSWASVSSGLTSAQGGIAVLSNGDTFVCGLNATPQIKVSKSSDGGGSWAVQTGSPDPDFSRDTTVPTQCGWVCGNNGALIYHVFSSHGGTRLFVSSSADGVTWTRLAQLDPPGYNALVAGTPSTTGVGQQFDSVPRIYMCQATGLLLVTCTATDAYGTATIAYASTDLGLTWSRGAVFCGSGSTSGPAWGVAAGRVFCTFGARLFVSDGIR